jgi:hypothetical protein
LWRELVWGNIKTGTYWYSKTRLMYESEMFANDQLLGFDFGNWSIVAAGRAAVALLFMLF